MPAQTPLANPDHAPLRIALLTEATSAGVGRHVIDLAHGLRDMGHSVDLLYAPHRIDRRFSDGIIDLRSRGVRTHTIDARHGLHFSDLSAIHQVREYLQQKGPFDILHSHSTKAGLVGRMAALGLSCRSVYTPHAFHTMSPHHGLAYRISHDLLERGLASAGDAVICVSQVEKEHALRIGIAESDLFVVHNGIDTGALQQYREQRTAMRRLFSLADQDVCIGFVGRMFPQKAPEVLLDAFALAQSDLGIPAKLVFVGDGPTRRRLEGKVIAHGLQKHVLLAGEVEGLLAISAFDIFALPSCYEAFPYVLLEAVAMGLPVVSTRVGGTKELVQEGVNGFTVPVADPAAMATALRKLLCDAALRMQMAAASANIAGAYSLANMAEKITLVYRTLLA